MRSLVLFVWLISGPLLHAKVIEVCASCKVKSVAKAVKMADSGDVIDINGGLYNEFNIEVDKPVTIKGRNNAVIDGTKKGYIFKVSANHVNIGGLILRNPGMSHIKDYAAIYMHRIRHFSITNCVLEGVYFGMLVEKSAHGIIRGNKISSKGSGEANTGNGIHLWHCDHVTIDQNYVTRMRDGIYFEFVSESKVNRNVSEGNFRYGLHFMFSNNDTYNDNSFERNGAGVAVMFSKYIEMRRNRFVRNWGMASYGLLLKEIYDAQIENNVFIENSVGVNAEGSSRVYYRNNTFLENGWAVKIIGACYTNVFESNNFSSNAFDVAYNSKMNDNRFDGNYWGDYTGYDLDRDGVGDVPHRPVKLFSYVVNRTPESVVLLRSLFIDLLNFSEKVSPVFTPDDLVDEAPQMKMIRP